MLVHITGGPMDDTCIIRSSIQALLRDLSAFATPDLTIKDLSPTGEASPEDSPFSSTCSSELPSRLEARERDPRFFGTLKVAVQSVKNREWTAEGSVVGGEKIALLVSLRSRSQGNLCLHGQASSPYCRLGRRCALT